MKHLVLSTSLDPRSRSRILCRELADQLREPDQEVEVLDLAALAPPLCGAPGYDLHPATQRLCTAIHSSQSVTIGLGIYNYAASAVAKTAVELGGKSWTGKVVSLLCAAGGRGSYMAALSLCNALMLDFRCVILPRFTYATGECFAEDRLVDEEIRTRVADQAAELRRFTSALSPTTRE